MSGDEHRLTLTCAATVGDYVCFTPLAYEQEGLVAVTAIEDGAHVVVHLTPADQERLRDWLTETLAAGSSTENGDAGVG